MHKLKLSSKWYLYILLFIPLVYIPNRPATSGKFQLYLILASAIILFIATFKPKLYKVRLPKTVIATTSFIFLSQFLTILSRNSFDKKIYFLGHDPDFMGIYAWALIIFGGMFIAPYVKEIFNKNSYKILLTIVVTSLFVDRFAIMSGWPITGVFVNEPTMGFFGNLLVVVSLNKQDTRKWGLIFGSLAVVLSQNLFAIVFLISMLLVNCAWYFYQNNNLNKQSILQLFIAITLLATTIFMPSYFWHLHKQDLGKGLKNQAQLYSQPIKNNGLNKILYNIGPATLSTELNNQNPVPYGIARKTPFKVSAFGRHNLIFDYYSFFGLIGLISLLFLIIRALIIQTKYFGSPEFTTFYLLLLAYHALFPPGLIVTSLLFSTIFFINFYKSDKKVTNKNVLNFSIFLVLIITLIGFLLTNFSKSINKTELSKLDQTKFDKTTEQVLTNNLDKFIASTNAPRGSAIIINANNGQILAASDRLTKDSKNCIDTVACINPDTPDYLTAWEPGSVIKPLTISTGIENNKLKLSDKFVNNSFLMVDDFAIFDALSHPTETITIQDILSISRNTGAVYALNKLGDNKQSKQIWHRALRDKFGFKEYVRDPKGGKFLDKQYSSSAYGIGVTATPLQIASAYAALINGGKYFAPYLQGQAETIGNQVISPNTSQLMKQSLQQVYKDTLKKSPPEGLEIGGKTGTAPAYDEYLYYKPVTDIGVYAGFIKSGDKTIILVVKIQEPKTKKFASITARDTWMSIAEDLF